MRKRICLFLLTFCLLLTACAPAAQPETAPVPEPDAPEEQTAGPDAEAPPALEEPPAPELSERDQNWINDIHYLQNNYKLYHPDPFLSLPGGRI